MRMVIWSPARQSPSASSSPGKLPRPSWRKPVPAVSDDRYNLRDQTAIVGVGNSSFARRTPDVSPLSLVEEALRMSLDDAGLRRDQIDGLLINISTPMGVDYDQTAEALG